MRTRNRVDQSDLPEFVHYRDEGCKWWPSCLECPYEKCVLDEPIKTRMKQQRNEEIKRKAKEGMVETDLSKEYSLSLRTIQRILNK